MFKHAFISVGIVAVLLTGIVPAGNACVLGATKGHECCTTSEPEPTSSCCANSEAPVPSSENDNAMDCTCDHPPATPGTVAATSSLSSTENDGHRAHTAHLAVAHEQAPTGVHAVEDRVRSHPPPPAYLLNCANLS